MYPTFACGENAPITPEITASPRAENAPAPSRSSAAPVGKRASPSSATLLRSVWCTLIFERTATSPTPNAEPSTTRSAESTGSCGVPAKKCAAVGPPNGITCASLCPCRLVDTSGTTTPRSNQSVTPYVAYMLVTATLRSRLSRNCMMSFSSTGIPIFEQSPPAIESQPGKFTFSCVKISSMSFIGTPRSVEKWNELRFTPTSARPWPSVWARSAKIGPADVDVFTGTPPSNRKVTPPDDAPIGKLPTLVDSAPPMNPIKLPFADTADGTKCEPCSRIDSGLLGSAVPARKSGSSPSPKMNSCEIFARSELAACACAARGADDRESAATAVAPNSLHRMWTLAFTVGGLVRAQPRAHARRY